MPQVPNPKEEELALDEFDLLEALRRASQKYGTVRVFEPYAAMTSDEQHLLREVADELSGAAMVSDHVRRKLEAEHMHGWESGNEEGRAEGEKELREKHPLAFKLIALVKKCAESEQELARMQFEIRNAKLELAKQHEQLGELGMRQIELAAESAAP